MHGAVPPQHDVRRPGDHGQRPRPLPAGGHRGGRGGGEDPGERAHALVDDGEGVLLRDGRGEALRDRLQGEEDAPLRAAVVVAAVRCGGGDGHGHFEVTKHSSL